MIFQHSTLSSFLLSQPTAATMKTKTHFFKNLNLSTILEPAAAGGAPPATKVVGTIGPSCLVGGWERGGGGVIVLFVLAL
jgi:hypothetical protein